MATSSSLACLFLFLTLTSSTSTGFSSSSIASQQLKFWYKNVNNNIPHAILSKLSPLSLHDSQYFSSLVSKPSFSSNTKFCSLANLACGANLNSIKPLDNINYKNNDVGPSIRPLDNINYHNNGVGPSIRPLDNINYHNNDVGPSIRPLDNINYHNNDVGPSIRPLDNINYHNNDVGPSIRPLDNINYQNNGIGPSIRPLDNINYQNNGIGQSIRPLDNINYKNNGVTQSINGDKVNPFSYFRLSILKQGQKLHLTNLQNPYPLRAFLPSQIASKVSLTSNEVLKRMFPQSFESKTTKEAIEMTLFSCNAKSMKGDLKSCPKSLEEMIQFSKNALGEKRVVALTSESAKGSGQELIVGSVKQYGTENFVSCHETFLPFATYFCHVLSSSRLYAVDLLEPESRVSVNKVLAVCHMDTSGWAPTHVAFKILKLTPGKGEACHWFSEIDMAWIGA